MTELSLATPKSQAEPGRLRRLFRWLAGDLRAALAILVLLVLVIVAIGAPWIAPYAPTAQDANNMLAAPGPGHLLGTDDLGRDISAGWSTARRRPSMPACSQSASPS